MDVNQITRLPGGVSTKDATNGVFYHYPYPDPTKCYSYFNDFTAYLAAEWTITTTEAGAGSATEALNNAAGGQLLVTNAAGDNDSDEFQLLNESFLMVAGKKSWFECRFQTSDATQSDILFGLVITDTAAIDGFTDGVVFQKDDGDTDIGFISYKDSAGTTNTTVATLADDTWIKMGFYFDGADFFLYADDVQKSREKAATIPDDEELRVSFALQNGEAVAKTMTVDYVFAAQER